VVFADCHLTNLLDRTPTEHRGVTFPSSSVAYHDSALGPLPRKDLDELFPDWRARVQQ
jgi:hypothetical protein